jgi:hypothetical protein
MVMVVPTVGWEWGGRAFLGFVALTGTVDEGESIAEKLFSTCFDGMVVLNATPACWGRGPEEEDRGDRNDARLSPQAQALMCARLLLEAKQRRDCSTHCWKRISHTGTL